MKNLGHTAMSLCALAIIFSGCVHAPASNTLATAKPRDSNPITITDTEPPPPDGVSLTTEYPVYPVGIDAINVVWKNDTDIIIRFGYGYHLDKKVDGKWARMSYVDRDEIIGWYAIGISIEPQSQADWSYELSFCYGFIEAGEYRIVTDFNFSSPTGGYRPHPIYAEFAIVSENPKNSIHTSPSNTEPQPSFPDGVSLVPEYSTYPVDVETIYAVWRNDTDKGIAFGVAMSLDKKVDGAWERVDFVQEVYWITMQYVIPPHSQFGLAYAINPYFGLLEAGEYRIVTNYSESAYTVVTESWALSEPHNRIANYQVYAEVTLV